MGFSKFLAWLRGEEQELKQVAGQIARRCFPDVWEKVADRTPLMSATEAHGYVKARSATALNAEVALFVPQLTHIRNVEDRLTRLAYSALTLLVSKQTLSFQLSAMPERRAA